MKGFRKIASKHFGHKLVIKSNNIKSSQIFRYGYSNSHVEYTKRQNSENLIIHMYNKYNSKVF